jgi:hypothetical protein
MENGVKMVGSRLVMAILFGAGVWFLIPPSTIAQPANGQPGHFVEMSDRAGRLIMVHIRTASPAALKRLRAMHVDIIRVRPAAQGPTDQTPRIGDVIVEAVIPRDLLPKLEALGFDVRRIPPM